MKHYKRLRANGDPAISKYRKDGTKSYLSGNAGHIELTRGYWAEIDVEDFDGVNEHVWAALKTKSNVYAYATIKQPDGTSRKMLLQQFLMNPPAGLEVDHIDRNTMNYHRWNLRIVNDQGSAQNQGRSKRNTSGYKGVCWDKQKGKWMARIKHNYKGIFLGYFNDPKDAARAYNKKARELEFLYIPPDPDESPTASGSMAA